MFVGLLSLCWFINHGWFLWFYNFIVTLLVYNYILISLDDFNFIIFTIFLQIYRFLFLIL
jgi:hypothetical protein